MYVAIPNLCRIVNYMKIIVENEFVMFLCKTNDLTTKVLLTAFTEWNTSAELTAELSQVQCQRWCRAVCRSGWYLQKYILLNLVQFSCNHYFIHNYDILKQLTMDIVKQTKYNNESIWECICVHENRPFTFQKQFLHATAGL